METQNKLVSLADGVQRVMNDLGRSVSTCRVDIRPQDVEELLQAVKWYVSTTLSERSEHERLRNIIHEFEQNHSRSQLELSAIESAILELDDREETLKATQIELVARRDSSHAILEYVKDEENHVGNNNWANKAAKLAELGKVPLYKESKGRRKVKAPEFGGGRKTVDDWMKVGASQLHKLSVKTASIKLKQRKHSLETEISAIGEQLKVLQSRLDRLEDIKKHLIDSRDKALQAASDIAAVFNPGGIAEAAKQRMTGIEKRVAASIDALVPRVAALSIGLEAVFGEILSVLTPPSEIGVPTLDALTVWLRHISDSLTLVQRHQQEFVHVIALLSG